MLFNSILKKNNKAIATAVLMLSTSVASAQEYETLVEDVVFNSSSKVVLDKKDIEKTRASTLAGVLATQGNIVVAANQFQPSSIYIRGSDAGYVLILVDGVPMYDASTTQRTLNLNAIDVKSVEKIEIIKGGQSVLYGGQAAAGVIKISTSLGVQEKSKALFNVAPQSGVDLGVVGTLAKTSNGYLNGRLFVGGKENKSPIQGSDQKYPALLGSTDLIYKTKFNDADVAYKVFHSRDDTRLSTTNQAPPRQSLDSDNFRQKSDITSASVVAQLAGVKKQRIALSYTYANREYLENSRTGSIVLGADDIYIGKTATARWDMEAFKNDSLQVDVGINGQSEQLIYKRTNVVQVDKSQFNVGAYSKAEMKINDDISAEAGVRYDHLDVVGNKFSAQAGLNLWKNTQVEVSNTFRNPSLFHLYSNYGNKDLTVESGSHVSLSHQLKINDWSQISGTVFHSDYKDMITITGSYPNFEYNNISKAQIDGVELNYAQKINDEYSMNLSAGYQEPWDQTSKTWLSRRPLSSGSLQLSRAWSSHVATLNVRSAGKRLDSSTKLPGYATVGFAWNEKYSDDLSYYVRLENLTDNRYQEFSGYYNRGFEGFVGGEWLF